MHILYTYIPIYIYRYIYIWHQPIPAGLMSGPPICITTALAQMPHSRCPRWSRIDPLDLDTLSPCCLQSLECPFSNYIILPTSHSTLTSPTPFANLPPSLHMKPGEPKAAPDGASCYNRKSSILCKAVSFARTLLCPVGLSFHLIHIDVQKTWHDT